MLDPSAFIGGNQIPMKMLFVDYGVVLRMAMDPDSKHPMAKAFREGTEEDEDFNLEEFTEFAGQIMGLEDKMNTGQFLKDMWGQKIVWFDTDGKGVKFGDERYDPGSAAE